MLRETAPKEASFEAAELLFDMHGINYQLQC